MNQALYAHMNNKRKMKKKNNNMLEVLSTVKVVGTNNVLFSCVTSQIGDF
jgi:hypothetical protein